MEKELIHVPFPVIVEGKYDKIRLSGIIDAPILTTDGFSLFRDKEKLAYLRKICDSRNGVIVFTDSDGAGLVIRGYLRTALGKERRVYHIYSPKIAGKERRKAEPSKAGVLGVEGIENDMLRDIFTAFLSGLGLQCETIENKSASVTKARLFADGLSGGAGSRERRQGLCKRLGIPDDISAGALLEAIELLGAEDIYEEYVNGLLPVASEQDPDNKGEKPGK